MSAPNQISAFVRIVFAGLVLVLGLHVSSQSAFAQAAAPDPVQAEKVQRFLELVDDPQVRAWLLSANPAKATAVETPAVISSEPTSYAGFATKFRAQAARLVEGLRVFPAETSKAAAVLQSELDASQSARPIFFVLAFVAAGLAAQWCFSWISRGWRAWIASLQFLTARDKLVAISTRLLWATCYVLAFALGSIGFFLAFDWPPLVREIVVGYLFAVVIYWLARVAFDFLLAPSGSRTFPNAERFRVVPVTDQAAAYWTKRLGYMVGWYAFGSVTVHLLTTLGFADPSRQMAAYALGIVLLILGIEAVWNRPAVVQSTEQAGRFSRIGVRARNWLWTGYFVALWLLWVAGAMKLFWIVVVAAALPGAIALTRASVDNLLRGSVADADAEVQYKPGVVSVMVERGIRAALIVGAIVLLSNVLDIDLTGITAQDSVPLRLMRGALSAGIILLVIDLIWNVVKVLIDRKLGETETAHEVGSERERRRARMRTLLPILKNVLMILFVAVAIMMALSAMGVEIAPLIAGAGVVGVAIGFGAQTVVKDIISGMFYLLDDAFRVGEYISSGSYKGTVESFSLRSVKLRHHRGAIYIVPFSELGAVQNLSRDWVVEKLTVTVGYDTDVDKARKIIKKIGQELLVDPELAPITIEPLKMQGIDSMGDSGLILRMKFTTVPGEQFTLKRRALMMINKAFHDADIKPAFPTVQVAGGDRSADVAAAAQQALAKHNEAIVAANA
ncbi:mechanosensitive ion channel family protein [Pararhizobium sp. BT-229]|uniref:mechanosensitive ion channel family protein n=1 Tax=Pararhizobium sp. BT-229 TaxID=2986923 RepID=UPI0021F714A8|nr:mechanosensitive ion channel family protein [Pararhizobium sp. BT-229]MCV9966866.1 mechanosensitive ion channel family protein [Pararhizobium sp. BT-229]